MPVALVLEWFARAAEALRPEFTFAAISDLKVLKGVRLSKWGQAPERLVVEVKLLQNGDGATVSAELRSPNGQKHYTATVRSERALPTPGAAPAAPTGLKAWSAPVYGDVLFHGPDFQVIRGLDGVSDQGLSARMVGLADQGWRGAWRTDVALVDGALQLALLYTQHALGGASLPLALGSFRSFAAPKAGEVTARLQGRVVGKTKSVTDVVLVGADGRVVAELRGVECTLIPNQGGEARV